ncbi:hypothetical protein ASZ90_006929 [hydrocarbon metagenome]|uniref:Uncharacterized protein n=1 Tax=hydrocarbon metagenome TaxID=938273 RepID=A0A0W8FR77_9ZZZZ
MRLSRTSDVDTRIPDARQQDANRWMSLTINYQFVIPAQAGIQFIIFITLRHV